MSEPAIRPSVVPLLWYDRPREAIDWLQQARGFEAVMVVSGDGDSVIHSELTFGNGALYVVGPASMGHGGTTPSNTGGLNTATVHLNLTEGLDAHCARARAAGAQILREPEDQHYGDRVYTCRDPQGHEWSFGQAVKVMTAEEMAKATGREIETKEKAHG